MAALCNGQGIKARKDINFISYKKGLRCSEKEIRFLGMEGLTHGNYIGMATLSPV